MTWQRLQSAVVDNLISFITESVTLIGSLVSMLLIDWKLTLVTFITVPVVLVDYQCFGKSFASQVMMYKVVWLTLQPFYKRLLVQFVL